MLQEWEHSSSARRRLARNGSTDLKLQWTQGLKSPCAGALNETVVAKFYQILAQTVEKYQVKPENIYNMDEKGVQFGIGIQQRVLVDRNQFAPGTCSSIVPCFRSLVGLQLSA